MTTLTIPTLTTERLILRAPTRADFDPFAAFMASDRSLHMGGPFNRPEAWAFFTTSLASWVVDGFGGWTIADRADGAWLGEIAVTRPDHFPEPELGWSLAQTAEGRGYATEAGVTVLDWARRAQVPSLVSYIAPENARSAALALRLGAARDMRAPLPRGETAAETHVYRHWGTPA